jgi:hypothetical protein
MVLIIELLDTCMIYHYANDKIQVGAIHEKDILESYRSLLRSICGNIVQLVRTHPSQG